jgi:DTW domain-containing protein YfiP
MHPLEPMRPTNTGWLVADVVADTEAFAWSRTQPDPRLLALLRDPDRQPYVVFPADAVAPERVVRAVAPTPGRRPLFVVLDGTWAETKKMFRKSPYLDALPVLALAAARPSRYRLRRSAEDANLCTAEVAALCLHLAGEGVAAAALDAWLDVFVRKTMWLRGQA